MQRSVGRPARKILGTKSGFWMVIGRARRMVWMVIEWNEGKWGKSAKLAMGAESSSEKRYENSRLGVSLDERFDADDRNERRNERGVCVSELTIVKREPNSELYTLCNGWAWVCPSVSECMRVRLL